MLFLSFAFLTGCEWIVERDIRVVIANATSDPIRLNIGGDDFVGDFPAEHTSQFIAVLSFVGSNNPVGPSRREQVRLPVSVTNLRTRQLSQTQYCTFEPAVLTTIEYRGNGFVICQSSR